MTNRESRDPRFRHQIIMKESAHMKQKPLLISLVLSTLLLAACSRGTASDSDPAAAPQAFEASPEMELLVGTLKLEGTDQEVDAAQAQELLPLWKMLKSLASSDTVAQEEMDAVIEQIEASMTGEQMAAIDGMDLTPEETFALMQDLGLAMGPGAGSAADDGSNSYSSGDIPAGSLPGGGEPPAGGFVVGGGGPPSGGGGPSFQGGGPGGGFFVDDGQEMTEEQQATAEALQANRPQMRLPIPLLDALITYLQERARP
jgi:hypothetical protein